MWPPSVTLEERQTFSQEWQIPELKKKAMQEELTRVKKLYQQDLKKKEKEAKEE